MAKLKIREFSKSDWKNIVAIKGDPGPQGPPGPPGEVAIDNRTLVYDENNKLKVNTTDEAESDNTLPITSAGVHTIVGNIEALLEII